MTGALLVRKLRRHRALLAALALCLAGFELLLVRVAAALETTFGLRSLLSMAPATVREAIEAQGGLVSFASAVAFGFQHPFTLAGTLGFVIVAATIPAADRESGFLDMVLARPVPRAAYFLAAAALVAAAALLLPWALLAGSAAGLRIVSVPGEIPWSRYVPCALGLTTLLLALGGIALLLGSGARRRGRPAAQAAGLTLAAFVVEVLGDAWAGLDRIRPASPFHYFKPVQAAIVPDTPVRNPIVLMAIFAVAAALAFVRFQRRDV